MTIPYSPVKISRQATKFTIVDTDGTTYVFGDDSGANFTQSSNFDYTSSLSYTAEYVPDLITSWHLTSIISADKSDTITLKYVKRTYTLSTNAEASLVQNIDLLNGMFRYTLNPSPGTNQSTVTEGVISEILFKNGKIAFNYTANAVLDSVRIYQKIGSVFTEIKRFRLFHSDFNNQSAPNSLRLDSLQETGLYNNQVAKNPPYVFKYTKYLNFESPPYNSKGQDYWGYFNGKVDNPNLLTVVAPVPESQTTRLPPVSAASRRIPDSNYLKVGALQSIQYPTDGFTYFDFEANQTPKTEVLRYNIYANYNYLGASVSESIVDYVPSVQFTVDQDLIMQSVPGNNAQTYNVKLHFEGTRLCTSGSSCIYNDPTVRLVDVTNNNAFVVSSVLSTLDNNSATFEAKDNYVTLVTGHTYRLYFPNPVVLSSGQNYKFLLNSYIQGIRSIQLDTTIIRDSMAILTGGLRIRKITSTDDLGNSLIKEYKYPGYYYNSSLFHGDFDAMALQNNSYEKWEVPPPPPYDNPPNYCRPAVLIGRTYTESRALPLGSASNNSLSYSEVEEYQSDGAGNSLGKTVYKYNQAVDVFNASMPLYKIDKENERNLVLEKTIYKRIGSTFSKVRSTSYSYTNLDAVWQYPADTVVFYTACALKYVLSVDNEFGGSGRNFPAYGYLNSPEYYKTNSYRIEKFFYTSPKIVTETEINKDYETEIKAIVDTTFYYYNNPKHIFPTRISKRDSRGVRVDQDTKYVLDYPYSSCTNVAETNFKQQLNTLKAAHYSAVIPILEKYYRNSVSTSPNPTSGVFPCSPKNGDSVVDTQNAYSLLVANYDNATSASSPLMTNYNTALTNYITCSNNYYNTASDDQKAIMNLQKQNNIAVELEKKEYKNSTLVSTWQSFFKTYQPNVTQTARIMGSVLGNTPESRIRFSNYDLNSNLLEVSKENDVKEVYFWGYNSKYPVAKITGTDYNTAKQYISQSVLDNSATTDAQMRTELNKLRLNLPNILVATYTYSPLIGLTSETDVMGNTTYYEYDGLGRLKVIKDRDNRIVKLFDYQYRSQVQPAPAWSATGVTRCKPCPQNTSYTSNIQQREEKDMNPQSESYQQSRWNDNGVNASCVVNPDWQNTTALLRCQKDGNNNNTTYQEQEQRDMNPCSSTFNQLRWIATGVNTTACPITACAMTVNCWGPSQKCIGGVCQTGVQVYTGSFNYDPNTGMYKCFYYYEFSDGSISTVQFEWSYEMCPN
jgi:YD repeat-containing protein